MTFEVKWENYDDKDNTFESYNTLKTNIMFHKYLKDNGHENLILKSYLNTISTQNNKNKSFLFYLLAENVNLNENLNLNQIEMKHVSIQTCDDEKL